MKVLNFGSLNYDYVYHVEHAVVPGETISSVEMDVFCGGKGLNQSIALARAGILVYHAGLVGEDGDLFFEVCNKDNVDTSYIKQISGKSGHAIIQLDKKGQNCIVLYGGSNKKITKQYVNEVLSGFTKGDFLLLQNEINHLDYIIEKAFEMGMKIILNPSPFNEELAKCDLEKVNIFLLNEVEGEAISGEKIPEKILEKLMRKFPQAEIVLTLGSKGILYGCGNQVLKQDIFKVKIVDTTAAGDTFTGYFVSCRIRGMSIKETLKLCAKAAAMAVSKEGASNSIPYIKEL